MAKRLEAVALVAVAPALAALTPRAAADDPLAPLVTAVAVAAWACTALLLVTCGLALLEQVPGAWGRTAGRVARRVTPAPLRVLVRTAVGLGVASAVLVGPTAVAAERAPGPAVSATLDWPGTSPAAAPVLARTTGAPAAPAGRPAAAPAPGPAPAVSPDPTGPAVVVRPGDSLWEIAARELGTAATDRQVAQAWPQWWSANRAVLGDDPDLIHPGTPLQHPAP